MKKSVLPTGTALLVSLLFSASTAIALSPTQDSDGDSIPDNQEDVNQNGVYEAGETNPYNADTDGGGESDGSEVQNQRNPEDASDDMTADNDGDGWVKALEIINNTSVDNPDTDADGAIDSQDPFPLDARYQYDLNANDLPDEWEKSVGLEEGQVAPTRSDDNDGDGLTNAEEFARGTSPILTDTDHDGVDDKTETLQGTNPTENACLAYANNTRIAAFPDILNHWSKDVVQKLRGASILPDSLPVIRGYGDGVDALFRPDQPVTRYEFLKMTMLSTCTKLWNSAAEGKPVFSDVISIPVINENADAALRRRVIYSAVRYGIIGGYDDGTFRADAQVNRAEALKIISLAAQLKIASESGGTVSPIYFSDVAGGDWFVEYVRQANDLGIVKGYEDGTFRPANPITRAEAAKIIYETMRRNPYINGYVLPE